MRPKLAIKAQWILIVGLLLEASIQGATPPTLPSEDRILQSSLELERRTMPWCPHECAMIVPFIADYRHGSDHLVFVGVQHVFRPGTPTMRAVAAGFDAIKAKVVILEGFPTAMGESPMPLVQEAHRYGRPDAEPFAHGEAMYAASLALARGIPFIGGEPTKAEEIQILKTKGFTDADIAFRSLLGWLSQAVRAAAIPDMSEQSIKKIYPALVEDVWTQNHLQAPSFDELQQRYRAVYGVNIVGDDVTARIDHVFDKTRYGSMDQIGMVTRDRNLLGLIEQQLTDRHSVLVVYGGSHWATLSSALEKRFGKPSIRPFIN